MTKLKKIIDVWNMIEKYEINGWVEEENAILIPDDEFERMFNAAKNKQYIRNLKK